MDENFGNISPWPSKIHIVKDEDGIQKALNRLHRYDVLGYDTETYHSVDRHIPAFHPADGARMRLAQFGTPDGHAYVFDLYKTGKEFLHKLFPNPMLIVGQNLKFEMKFLMHELGIYKFGPIWDTLIAEQIISRGDINKRVALDQIAKRRLGIHLPKDEQASSWYRETLDKDQIQYAATDGTVVLPIWQVQRDIIAQQGQWRVAELEFDTIPALAWMENNGVYLDPDKWEKIYRASEKEIEEIKRELWGLIGRQRTLWEDMPTVKLTSQPQVLGALIDAGINVPVDKEGKVSIAKNNLKHLFDRREVQLYSQFVTLQKQMSSFGIEWFKFINPFTHRVHCELKQIGAETGRLAAKRPNLMQIKKDDAYRNAFRAREGWVFIDTDYSQCELRILARLCRDPNLLKAFLNDYDLHTYSASLIYKVAMEEVTKKQRGVAKNLNFGIVYGIGKQKFATQAEITEEDAEKIMKYYLKDAYPRLGSYLEGQGSQVLHTFTAKTQLGRVRRYKIDFEDKQDVAEVQRNSKNLPVQGGNADITKRAMALFYKAIVQRNWQDVCKMNLVIHDELLTECRPDYAVDVQFIKEKMMLEAEREFLHDVVPSKVDTDVTLMWCKEPTPEQKTEAQNLIKDWGGQYGKAFGPEDVKPIR
jgi:DNA polymerase-1